MITIHCLDSIEMCMWLVATVEKFYDILKRIHGTENAQCGL